MSYIISSKGTRIRNFSGMKIGKWTVLDYFYDAKNILSWNCICEK